VRGGRTRCGPQGAGARRGRPPTVRRDAVARAAAGVRGHGHVYARAWPALHHRGAGPRGAHAFVALGWRAQTRGNRGAGAGGARRGLAE